MNERGKAIIKQVTPPILLSAARRVLGRKAKPRPKRGNPEVDALRKEHDVRNREAAGDEVVLRDGLVLKLHPESRVAFEHFSYISPVMVTEMNCFLEHTRDKSRLLDIGALHGIFSLVFALSGSGRKVVAVDASPVAFARLLYNIHKNGLDNIAPVECALSDAAGILQMHYEWEHAVAAKSSEENQKVLAVPSKRGDSLCEELSFRPDVIKIDVEGHEVKVVRGLAKVIRELGPMVFLELHPGRIRDEDEALDDLIAVFSGAGYRAALVDGTAVRLEELREFSEDQRVVLERRD